MATKIKWPKEITIPSEVGEGSLEAYSGGPCCALGHAAQEVYGDASKGYDLDTQDSPFRSAYVKVTDAYQGSCRRLEETDDYYVSVVDINDDAGDGDRRLLYLAAWAYLGYTEGMPKAAVNLANKAKKLKKGAKTAA